MNFRIAIILLLVPAALFGAAGLRAEEDPLESMPLETIVVTATRREESVLDVAGAVSVVGRDEISRQSPDVLAEMMRGLPGAYFQQTTPGQGIPIIRGLKGSEVLHLVDGMRLNNAFFRNAPNQYLGLVDAYAVERSEVVRGSAPSLYGADAMGGVLQVLTAEPEFDQAEWAATGRLYGSYNSADNGFVGRAATAAGRTGSTLSGGLTYQSHDDRTVGGGGEISPSGYRVQAADLKYRQELGRQTELMLSWQWLEQPSTPRVDELVAGYGQENPASEQYEFRPNRRTFLHARFRHRNESRWLSAWEIHLARQELTDDRLTQDWESPLVNRESNRSVLDGLTVQLRSDWSPAGHFLTWGAELYRDDVDSRRLRSNLENGETGEVRPRFPDGSSMDSSAIYVSSHWLLERFSVDAGLRYSRFTITLPTASDMAAVRLEPDDLTGDLHLNYRLSESLRLVANLGRGFRPPNVFDLGTLGPRPGNRFNVPNPGLEPESVWSYDLGLKFSTQRWQAEVFAWYADYRDKISSQFTGEITPEGRFVVRSANLNRVDLYGLESGFRWYSGDAGEFYGVLNYTRGEERVPQGLTVPADRIPPLNGRFGWLGQPGRLRLEAWLDFASRQDRLSPRDVGDPRIDPTGTAGWGTINLLLAWSHSDNAQIGVRLQNLADKNYREHGSGIDASGRNFGIWMDYQF